MDDITIQVRDPIGLAMIASLTPQDWLDFGPVVADALTARINAQLNINLIWHCMASFPAEQRHWTINSRDYLILALAYG